MDISILTTIGAPALTIGALVIVGLVTWGMAYGFHRYMNAEQRDKAGITAAAYMTALGSLFAILTGFLINSEYGTLRQAQDVVAVEVSAASRLAYASAGLPPADGERLQADLSRYLDGLLNGEWRALERREADASPAVPALRRLQQDAAALGSRKYVANATAGALQNAVDDMTQGRRERVAIADRSLPTPLFILALIAGLALAGNALLVSNRSGRNYGLVAGGIVVIIALDVAAILAISAPFQGAFLVDTAPISQLASEVQTGQYLPFVVQP
jgi:hypothetical protein